MWPGQVQYCLLLDDVDCTFDMIFYKLFYCEHMLTYKGSFSLAKFFQDLQFCTVIHRLLLLVFLSAFFHNVNTP